MADLTAPRIGDFSRSPVDRPPTPSAQATPPSPTKDALDAAEARLDSEASKDEAILKPLASFEEKLAAAGLTKVKAAEIVDAVLLQGFYAEDIKITSTIRARFRTRGARDVRRAQEMLEAQRFTIDTHYAEMWGRLMLAASLESFGKDKLEQPERKTPADIVEKLFQERYAYVDNLPDPALRILLTKLWKFDGKISVALDEGTIENF